MIYIVHSSLNSKHQGSLALAQIKGNVFTLVMNPNLLNLIFSFNKLKKKRLERRDGKNNAIVLKD